MSALLTGKARRFRHLRVRVAPVVAAVDAYWAAVKVLRKVQRTADRGILHPWPASSNLWPLVVRAYDRVELARRRVTRAALRAFKR